MQNDQGKHMIFQNQQIDLSLLPSVNDLDFHKPAPAYLKVKLIGTAIFITIFLIPAYFLAFHGPGENYVWVRFLLVGIWLVLLLFSLWLSWKGFHIQGHAIREKDVNYKKGVIFHSVTSIPFNRVQHCEIKQGPIARRFGLSTLEVFTAGGQSSDLSIPGITPEYAQQLKEYIMNKTSIEEDGIEE